MIETRTTTIIHDNTKLDQIFSSSGRTRILTVLSQTDEGLHLTEIARRTEQSYTATERHLKNLAKANIVSEQDYGRVRVFRLNLENPRGRLLKQLVTQWNNASSNIIETEA
jgi:DNA-binding transcriptional ArsR family regulator